MTPLGIKIFDADGESLLSTQLAKPCQAAKSDLTEPPQLSERTPDDQEDKHTHRQPCECRKVGGRRQALNNGPKFPSTTVGPPKAVVRLIRACNLPARTGKLLKAKLPLSRITSPLNLFEPRVHLLGGAIEIADAIVEPNERGHMLIPVCNYAASPTRLRRGQIIGHMQLAELLEDEPKSQSSSESSPSKKDQQIEHQLSLSEAHSRSEDEAIEEDTSLTPEIRAIALDHTRPKEERLERLKAELDLGKTAISPEERQALETLLLDHADIFATDSSELGRTKVVQHPIEVGDHRPVQQPPRRIPFSLRHLVDEMVREMLDLKIIQHSHSPWASPIVLVKKKDGSMRFCVDYRRLNSITKRDVHPLPRIDDTLDALAGARYLSTLDLASGYWQVTMDPAAKEKTAFITHSGLYEFNAMPFGLCNAPATFQRLMEIVLAGLTRNQCFVYLDDILIISSTWKEHLENISLVFERLRKAELRLKPKKCVFGREEVTYLGHVVSATGISVDPAKVEKVRNYPTPTNLKSLRQFLGLASYYRRFIPQFSKVANPLYALTRKNVPFAWTPLCEEAFENLLKLLTTPPVLTFPNFEVPFILETDASGSGLGAVLSQKQEDGAIRPVAYASRTLQKHERNYTISELEALAVVWATKHFHVYLYGHKCTAFTDHSALKYLLNTPHPSGKLARWGLALQELDLDIQYRPGKENTNADVLSRIAQVEGGQPRQDDFQVVTQLKPDVPEVTIATLTTSPNSSESEQGEWPLMQRNDEDTAAMIAYLETGTLPTNAAMAQKIAREAPTFSLVDRVLFHTQPSGQLKVVVPSEQRQKLIQEIHGGIFSGHLREAKTYSQLQKHYWWPGMRADVQRWCQGCLTCSSRHVGRAERSPLMPIPVAGPFDCVGVDIIQFPCSYDGNKYAVIFVDYLTKWPEAFAIPDQTAETIARIFVEEIISRHGVPGKLLSDRGANFLSGQLQEVYHAPYGHQEAEYLSLSPTDRRFG